MLASLVGFLGDFDLAEEVAQEAFAVAAERWERDGVPASPVAWLITTARNGAVDRLRRERTLTGKLPLLELPSTTEFEMPDDSPIPDERLELIFTCCHPALAAEAQVALTLQALGGLSTERVARAFIVAPETMKRRLSRAKAKIRAAGIPFTVPPEHLLEERLSVVLAVVYLIFNEGYAGREELAGEAIRLGGVLAQLMPRRAEVHGLLALMLFHDARRRARFAGGELVLLADQDRSLWNSAQIGQGQAELVWALKGAERGPYALQAQIAWLQVQDELDWPQIAEHYGELARLTGSEVVELNRAVAVAEAEGPEQALEIVDRLTLPAYQYLHSTRAELLVRLGRGEEAAAAYRQALELTRAEPERRWLERRLGEL